MKIDSQMNFKSFFPFYKLISIVSFVFMMSLISDERFTVVISSAMYKKASSVKMRMIKLKRNIIYKIKSSTDR